MSGLPRRARVRAFAKINLCLEVLDKRPDGYHNLRTIFQTISLADVLDIEFAPSQRSHIELVSSVDIPDNLVTRAAEAVVEAGGIQGEVRLRLRKRIPMGAGLGGGSTDAAAVLLALPKLAGCNIQHEKLMDVAARLGSDVPFFLLGGTALGVGRGTELYPLARARADNVLLVTPTVHSSTAGAYASLGRTDTYLPQHNACAFTAQALAVGENWASYASNDFEASVFTAHPELADIRTLLERAGARPARMTGSGAAIYGIFDEAASLAEARRQLGDIPSHAVRFITRRQQLGGIS